MPTVRVVNLIEQLKGGEGTIAEAENRVEAAGTGSRRESALRAAVLATYAAAQLHTTPYLAAERTETWREVARKLERHPTADGRERLRLRASAALCTLDRDFEHLFKLLDTIFQTKLDEQTIASFVVALESLVEDREPIPHRPSFQETPGKYEEILSPVQQEQPSWEPLLVFVDQLDSVQISPELHTFALVLAARACKLAGNWHRMEQYFARSLRRLPELRNSLQSWLDWLAPEDLTARVRLEYIRAFYPALHSPQEVLEHVSTADFAGDDIKSNLDSESLRTALLQLRGAQASPTLVISRLDSFPSARLTSVKGDFRREPHCNAHRIFQPFFCAVTEEVAALGKVEQALAELQELSRSAEQTVVNTDTVHAIERTILRIVRRMRLRDEGYKLGSDFPMLDEEWALDGLSGPRIEPAALVEASRWVGSLFALDSTRNREGVALLSHARWRTSYTLRPNWAMNALSSQLSLIEQLLSFQEQREGASFASLSLFLDALEVNEVTMRIGVSPVLPTLTDARLSEIRDTWFAAHPDQPVEGLTLALRIAVLGQKRSTITRFSGAPVQRVGVRRAAQIALDEGELLALRLPERAIPLLNQARIWFAAAQDVFGQFISIIALALVQARLGNRDQVRSLLCSHFGERYFAYIPSLTDRVLNDKQFDFRTKVPHISQEDYAVNPPSSPERALFRRVFEEVALGHRDFAGVDLLSRAWRPWLIRLLACALWSEDQEANMQTLAIWLENHYSLTLLQPTTLQPIDGEKVLPAELDDWPEWPVKQPDLVRHPQSDQLEIVQFNQTRGILTEDVVVLSFVGKERPSSKTRGALVVTMALVAAIGAATGSPVLTSTALTSLISSFGSYFQSARRNAELKKLVQLIPPARPITLELRIDEASSAICWESLITSALEEADEPGPGRIDFQQIQFYRTMSKAPVWPKKFPRIIFEIEAAGNNSDAVALQNVVWRRLVENNDERLSVRITDTERLFFARQRLSLQKTDVLHLVAPVIETGSGGVRIEFGGDLGNERQLSSASGSRGRLWDAEELAYSFHNLTFCLLQAPLAAMTRRSETDREHAALQRRFAAQLFAHGIPIVLTIPTLPYEVGEQVVGIFSEALHSLEVPSLAALLAALARARASIIEGRIALREEDAWEIAFDMSLFFAREEKDRSRD